MHVEKRIPDERDASSILSAALGKQAQLVHRFATGLANYVYDVTTVEGERVVVRLARPDLGHAMAGAVYWYDPLRERDVPLPRLRYAETEGVKHGFPVMIMDRLPGTDLGAVYPRLTTAQKRRLAARIARVQGVVAGLAEGAGYGYARSYDDPSLHRSWTGVLRVSLERSQERIAAAGVFPTDATARVAGLLERHAAYLATVRPTPFLDDATTKNVIVGDDGALSGIVDVDHLAFGDPLFAVALTRMSLLASGNDTEYVDFWGDELDLDPRQRAALDAYTAVFCVDFMGEVGHAFNREQPGSIDGAEAEVLRGTLERLLQNA